MILSIMFMGGSCQTGTGAFAVPFFCREEYDFAIGLTLFIL